MSGRPGTPPRVFSLGPELFARVDAYARRTRQPRSHAARTLILLGAPRLTSRASELAAAAERLALGGEVVWLPFVTSRDVDRLLDQAEDRLRFIRRTRARRGRASLAVRLLLDAGLDAVALDPSLDVGAAARRRYASACRRAWALPWAGVKPEGASDRIDPTDAGACP